jgi:hypothetical protein
VGHIDRNTERYLVLPGSQLLLTDSLQYTVGVRIYRGVDTPNRNGCALWNFKNLAGVWLCLFFTHEREQVSLQVLVLSVSAVETR